jgi:hypothetical protein
LPVFTNNIAISIKKGNFYWKKGKYDKDSKEDEDDENA